MNANPKLLGSILDHPLPPVGVNDLEALTGARLSMERLDCGLQTRRRQKTLQTNNPRETIKEIVTYLRALQPEGVIFAAISHKVFGLIREPNASHAKLIVVLSRYTQGVSVELTGDEELVENTLELLEKNFSIPGALITTLTDYAAGKAGSGFTLSSSFVRHDEKVLAHDVFYPFLKVPMEEYMKAFMQAKAPVLLLLGPAGTGKSTFLRTLIVHHVKEAMVAYNKSVLESPKLIEYFQGGTDTILGLEDVDLYIDARERGNLLMPGFLNGADGVAIANKTKKIVFSTNLPSIDKVDSALLRRGRCFDVLEFRLLTPNEAYAVSEKLGLPERDYYTREAWTLADVLNPPEEFLNMAERIKHGVGFY